MYSLLLVSTLMVSPTCGATIMVKRMCCCSGSIIREVLSCVEASTAGAGVCCSGHALQNISSRCCVPPATGNSSRGSSHLDEQGHFDHRACFQLCWFAAACSIGQKQSQPLTLRRRGSFGLQHQLSRKSCQHDSTRIQHPSAPDCVFPFTPGSVSTTCSSTFLGRSTLMTRSFHFSSCASMPSYVTARSIGGELRLPVMGPCQGCNHNG
jgi:hypothetical protein